MKKFAFATFMVISVLLLILVCGLILSVNVKYQLDVYELQVKDFEKDGLKAPEPPFWYNWFIKTETYATPSSHGVGRP